MHAVAELSTLESTTLGAPVPVGSRVRLGAMVEKVEPVPAGYQVALAVMIDCDAVPKPACVAQVLYRFLGPTEAAAGRAK